MNKLTHPFSLLPLLFSMPLLMHAQTIRSIHLNPPSTDEGFEYIEIQHTPGTALTGITFVEIDGDATNSGIINTAIDLSSFSTGSNGVLLIRDGATVLNPAPDPATNVVVFNFTPDLQNGTGTYLLVTGFTGAVNTDYDPEGDGTLNTTPWATVVDAISGNDGGSGDDQYADDFGFPNLPDIAAAAFDGLANYSGTWYAFDINGTSVNPGPYSIQAIWDVNGTSDPSLVGWVLTPGATANPLPVGLSSIDARALSTAIVLSFTTASEYNCDYFDIQHSANGYLFLEMGQIKGAGNSNTPTPYSFTDENPVRGTNYYRLRQVDTDGQFTFSKVVSAQFGKTGNLVVFPTEATTAVQVQLEDSFQNDAIWQVLDMAGRMIQEGPINAEHTLFEIETSHLPTGGYVLRVIAGQEVITGQFHKQ